VSGGTTRDSEGPATGRFGRLMKLASTVDLAVASYGEPLPDTPCRDAVALTARTTGVSHSWYGLILSEGGGI
jgi:hypothetical protein